MPSTCHSILIIPVSVDSQELSWEVVRYATRTEDGWIIETAGELKPAGRPSVSIALSSEGKALSSEGKALSSEGKPHIAYGDAEPDEARYAVKIESEWVIEEVGDIDPSLALDSNNNPHISHYAVDRGNIVLKYSKKIGEAGSTRPLIHRTGISDHPLWL